jgi:hypothetical protein
MRPNILIPLKVGSGTLATLPSIRFRELQSISIAVYIVNARLLFVSVETGIIIQSAMPTGL